MERAAMTAGFAAPSTRRLRRRGVAGKARVTLHAGALHIAGAEAGVLVLTPASVRRMRSGWEETKYGPHHETRLWLDNETEPLILHLLGRDTAGYAAAIRGFAAELAKAGGQLEAGTSKAAALYFPIAFGLLTAAALVISLFVITEEPWWGRMLVPVAPLTVFAYGLRMARRMWPRPVADLQEFGRKLAM